LLSYALHRHDPVFVIGELIGTLIYLRNLQFAWRARSHRVLRAEHGIVVGGQR
jgi:lipid-A-disaccharide synthase-like uncharacterized protein